MRPSIYSGKSRQQRYKSVGNLRQPPNTRKPLPLLNPAKLKLKRVTRGLSSLSTSVAGQPSSLQSLQTRKAGKLVHYLDTLRDAEQTVSDFFSSKSSTYRNLRERLDAFFANELREVELMSTQWRSKIAEIKRGLKRADNDMALVKQQAFDASADLSRQQFDADFISEDTELAYDEQKLQQIDYETAILNRGLQKMKSTENQREGYIVATCNRLIGPASGVDTVPVGGGIPCSQTAVSGISANPNRTPVPNGKIAVKFDVSRPYDIFFLDLETLAFTRARVGNLSVPPDSAAIYIDYRYFICGGRSGSTMLQYNSTFELDSMLLRLNKVADMAVEKRNHALAAVDSRAFYSICGYNESVGYIGTCEKYVIDEDRWVQMPDAREKRQDPSACAVGNRRIYLFGGGIYANGEWVYSDDIEYFDVTEEAAGWRQVLLREGDAFVPRMYTGTVQISELQVLLFGGYNGTHTTDCFVFNLAERSLQLIDSRLPRPCSFILRNAGPGVRNSTVYAVGANSLDLYTFNLGEMRWRPTIRREGDLRGEK